MQSTHLRADGAQESQVGREGLMSSFILSYLIGALLIAALVANAGVWDILASTRLLDLLIRGGIVQIHDEAAGFIEGVPDLKYYIQSQDPIDVGLILVALGIFFIVWGSKAIQAHHIARFSGIPGSLGQHSRAYLYGLGIGRLLPFEVGNVAQASTLVDQGAPRDRASLAIFVGEMFIVFEIVVFSIVGLFLVDWAAWLGMLFWALVILAASYVFMRASLRRPALAVGAHSFREVLQVVAVLLQQPRLLAKLVVLSLVAFSFQDFAAYTIAMAFTANHVILHIPTNVLLMGVVGLYISRLIQVTPGGIGQGEWGLLAVLWVGGIDFPAAATIALLVLVVRMASILILFGAVTLVYGVETNLSRVLELFSAPRPREQPAAEVEPRPALAT